MARQPAIEGADAEFERALRGLEESTESLLSTEASDLVALSNALEHRAEAITRVALAAEGARGMRAYNEAAERLAVVLVRGEESTRRLLNERRQLVEQRRQAQAVAEMSNREPEGGSVDCAG